MIAVDTSILVRFLVRDNEKQAQAADARFKRAETTREQIHDSLPVVLETIWVLESAYGLSRSEILDGLRDLKRMPILAFSRETAVERFLEEGSKTNVDLADVLIAVDIQESGCEACLTFDKKATQHAGFKWLESSG